MDLRPYLASGAAEAATAGLLDYQPFILSDDIQTGVAHSWLFADDPRVAPKLVFRRQDCTLERWQAVTDANRRLRAICDDRRRCWT